MNYFTNLGSRIELLPSYCGYISARYNPVRPEVLLAPARGIHPKFSTALYQSLTRYLQANSSSRLRIAGIRELYSSHYEYTDLASHPAVIILPYQVSFMSLFELYRMGVPIYVPSIAMLSNWHIRHAVLSERTWDRVFGHPRDHSAITRAKNSTGSTMLYDPNNEFDEAAVKEWITLADFYQWPYITQFDSFEELFAQLTDSTSSSFMKLKEISSKMQTYNQQVEHDIHAKWTRILDKIIDRKLAMTSSSPQQLPVDIDEALLQSYGYRLSEHCHGQIE
jgi:hypothetical protein